MIVSSGCSVHHVDTNVPPNFRVVEPGLVRGGQPTTETQWRYAAAQLDAMRPGRHHYRIKLDYYDEGPPDDGGSEAAGFTIVYLPMQPADDRSFFQNFADTFIEPNYANDAAIQRTMEDHLEDGVYIGCIHGWDRTGYEVAIWRVLHDGWSKFAARSEWQDIIGFPPHPLYGLDHTWENWHPDSLGRFAPTLFQR